jgi:hypothetical protein
MKKIVLDTNAYTSYLAGDEKILNAIAKPKHFPSCK